MTEIERKALELVNEVRAERNVAVSSYYDAKEALCRAIEQHEAFRQEVSDAVADLFEMAVEGIPYGLKPRLHRFIIAKPDPLVEVLRDIGGEGGYDNYDHYAHRLRSALEVRGLEIREKVK